MTRSSALRFVLLGTVWGSSYTFIKVSLDGLTPAQLVLARIGLGLIVLLAFIQFRGIRMPKSGGVWVHGAVAAALGLVIPFMLLAYGEQHTSAAMAGVLTAALPLTTLAAATALLPSERATSRKIVGFLIGFAGVVLIVAPWEGASGTLIGQLAVLGSTVSYAAQAVYIRKFIVPYGIPPVALAASQLVMATILQAAVMPVMTWETPHLTWPVVISVGILGVLSTGIAYVLYFRLIADFGASTAAAVNYLVPVVGVAASATLLGESVTWSMVAGAIIVLVGLAVAENRTSLARHSQATGQSQPDEGSGPPGAVATAAPGRPH
jgi:drug/metabolite transporter (DMT)-like permease